VILLDTNVISELMRPSPSPRVIDFIRQQQTDTLFISSLAEAEIRYGIFRLPRGRRRDFLADSFQRFLALGFDGRIIAFDSAAAAAYAEIRTRREQSGLPVTIPDAMIAATALACGASVATRNVAYFIACGIGVMDPWGGS
jgi:predicted nucleic acid-binding protein